MFEWSNFTSEWWNQFFKTILIQNYTILSLLRSIVLHVEIIPLIYGGEMLGKATVEECHF